MFPSVCANTACNHAQLEPKSLKQKFEVTSLTVFGFGNLLLFV